MNTAPADGLRWYTRARRIPRLVGKLHGSERGLPGGPYTITQVVGGAAVFLLAGQTRGLWGRFGFLGNLTVQCLLVAVTVLALRLVKPGGRDPVSATAAALDVWSGPRWGRYAGRRVTVAAPQQVRARVRVLVPSAAAALGAAALVDHPRLADPPTVRAGAAVPVSNLARLLAHPPAAQVSAADHTTYA